MNRRFLIPLPPSSASVRRLGRSAFTLTELLISITLYSAVALLAAHFFQTSLKTSVRAEQAHTTATRWDHMIGLMRSDTWTAQQIVVPSSNVAEIKRGNASTVVWRVDADRVVHRVVHADGAPAETMRWPALERGVEFSLSDTDLIVTRPPGNGTSERHRLVVASTLMQEVRR